MSDINLYKPFGVPCLVPLVDGTTVPLKVIPADTLSDMCDVFRREVFKKANRKDPKE